jgi:2-dehydropantoate 2-reductase
LTDPHSSRPPVHVAVIGPGAIGLCFAVRLAMAPCNLRVTLIDHRPDRAARLSGRPLVVHAPGGDLRKRLPVATAPDAPVDLAILAVKAPAVREAVLTAAPWLGAAPIVTLENGLGVADEAKAAAPSAHVITGVIYQGANLVGEGEVNHVANLDVLLGYEGRAPDDAVERAAALLRAAGFPVRVEADMTPAVWGKLLVNAAINPVAALAGATNGEVAARRTLCAMAVAIAEEGEAVARAAGVTLPCASATQAALETARRTADNRCSMLQDLDARRLTEIEFLNGAIVRTAGRHGIAVPANRAVTALVRQVSGLAGA